MDEEKDKDVLCVKTNDIETSGVLQDTTHIGRKRNYTVFLDVLVLCLVFYYFGHVSTQKSSLTHVTTKGTVIATGSLRFSGTEEEAKQFGAAAEAKYWVDVSYNYGSREYKTTLYYVENPKLSNGDGITVRISRLNPRKVE